MWSLLALGLQPTPAPQLAAGLSTYLHAQLSAGLMAASQHDADGTARRLVSSLATLAPTTENTNGWCRHQGLRLAQGLQRDPGLASSLAAGSLSVAQALAQIDRDRQAAEAVYEAIDGHHRRLRDEVSSDWMADWQEATAEGSVALRRYAEAAAEIGKKEWARAGISWCAEQAVNFHHGGGARKLVLREAHASRGPAPGTAAPHEDAVAPGEGCRAVRLLDVGACGNLFDGFPGIEATAIDLCPQRDAQRTFQCDFLRLEVGGAEREVRPSSAVHAGSLVRWPAAATDVVVLSLVLSYLPQPRQRAAMVAQARRVLQAPPPHRGLLLVVDTMAVEGKARAWRKQSNVRAWVAAFEALGFVFVRHQTLARSHALAFATAELTDEELEERLAASALPELLLKREVEDRAAHVQAS